MRAIWQRRPSVTDRSRRHYQREPGSRPAVSQATFDRPLPLPLLLLLPPPLPSQGPARPIRALCYDTDDWLSVTVTTGHFRL